LADDPNLTAIEAGIESVLAGAELSFAFEINAPKVASSRRGRCATVRVNERRWTVICLGRHESHGSPDVAASPAAPMPQLSTRATTEHEIRNSLNAVIGFAQLLTSGISGPLNEKQAQYAELILRQGQQALEHLCSWIAASR
jgi:signal transduction histidine kinase